MNPEDVAVLRAERAASPDRFRTFDPTNQFESHYGPDSAPHPRREIEPQERASTSSISTRESYEEIESIRGGAGHLSRTQTETERINKHESHPTALDRIETHRSQHSQTVGGLDNLRSRSKRELPKFGAGKPYPPSLPKQEEYVVEFDGPHDPMHPQQWTMKKK